MAGAQELFYKITEIDNTTFTILILIAGIASMAIRNSLAMPGLIVIIMPLMLGLSMVANFAFVSFEFFQQNRIDQWVMGVIAAGTSGAIIGIALAALVGKLFDRKQTQTA
ncbi:MAG: hypothetical protein ABL898_05730 [Hyphomicrobiaceae bacterium]|nr:hypothetical protein [Hyphomicrobiaceae bacterium]